MLCLLPMSPTTFLSLNVTGNWGYDNRPSSKKYGKFFEENDRDGGRTILMLHSCTSSCCSPQSIF